MTNNFGIAAEMTIDQKPYYEMTLAEYEITSHSQTVPRWSILAYHRNNTRFLFCAVSNPRGSESLVISNGCPKTPHFRNHIPRESI